MVDIVFKWDSAKAKSNSEKHGVSFENTIRIFGDPLHITWQDRIENGEYRWQTIGQIYGATVLLVAHTFEEEGPEPAEVIRIISARKATRAERKRYENENR